MIVGFPAVKSAIVALATEKTRLLVIARAPFPHVVQEIPKAKGPVPSPLKVPVFACNVLPGKRLSDANVTHHNASAVEFE